MAPDNQAVFGVPALTQRQMFPPEDGRHRFEFPLKDAVSVVDHEMNTDSHQAVPLGTAATSNQPSALR